MQRIHVQPSFVRNFSVRSGLFSAVAECGACLRISADRHRLPGVSFAFDLTVLDHVFYGRRNFRRAFQSCGVAGACRGRTSSGRQRGRLRHRAGGSKRDWLFLDLGHVVRSRACNRREGGRQIECLSKQPRIRRSTGRAVVRKSAPKRFSIASSIMSRASEPDIPALATAVQAMISRSKASIMKASGMTSPFQQTNSSPSEH